MLELNMFSSTRDIAREMNRIYRGKYTEEERKHFEFFNSRNSDDNSKPTEEYKKYLRKIEKVAVTLEEVEFYAKLFLFRDGCSCNFKNPERFWNAGWFKLIPCLYTQIFEEHTILDEFTFSLYDVSMLSIEDKTKLLMWKVFQLQIDLKVVIATFNSFSRKYCEYESKREYDIVQNPNAFDCDEYRYISEYVNFFSNVYANHYLDKTVKTWQEVNLTPEKIEIFYSDKNLPIYCNNLLAQLPKIDNDLVFREHSNFDQLLKQKKDNPKLANRRRMFVSFNDRSKISTLYDAILLSKVNYPCYYILKNTQTQLMKLIKVSDKSVIVIKSIDHDNWILRNEPYFQYYCNCNIPGLGNRENPIIRETIKSAEQVKQNKENSDRIFEFDSVEDYKSCLKEELESKYNLLDNTPFIDDCFGIPLKETYVCKEKDTIYKMLFEVEYDFMCWLGQPTAKGYKRKDFTPENIEYLCRVIGVSDDDIVVCKLMDTKLEPKYTYRYVSSW